MLRQDELEKVAVSTFSTFLIYCGMRLICLNIWGGRAGEELLTGFLASKHESTDIFCFQEVWADFYHDLEGVLAGGRPISNEHVIGKGLQLLTNSLPDHNTYFHPCFRQHWGNALYVRKTFSVSATGDEFIFQERGYEPKDDVGRCGRNLQYVTIKTANGPVTVINLHGLWNGMGKTDTEERLEQSRRILAFTQTLNHPFVLAGDFNLEPSTKSLRMLEDAGLRNLIKEYGITSTRTSFYEKPGKFADYIFVSDGIQVNDFAVLPDEVSDHAPLMLDFEVS